MLPRFYAPDLDREHDLVTLPGDEARHLTRVLRLGAGDPVTVFDGRGLEYRAVVEVAVRETASLRLVERLPAPPAPPVQLVVVQAILKGGSMDDAVRDATMMGAEAIEPILTDYTDVKVSLARRPANVERWQRVALAAVKQSRRVTLPSIREPQTFDEWLAEPAGWMRLIFVEPSAGRMRQGLRSLLEYDLPARASVLLGPEGGWSPREVDAAVGSGCVPVALGSLTLRAESMPVAALAALHAVWEQP